MGTLALTDVRPDLPATLVRRQREPRVRRGSTTGIASVGRRDGRDRGGRRSRGRCRSCTTSSRARATPAAGSSSSRSCARACPNYPVVADTVLTAETREDFPRGVDVLTDKATWSGGDVGDLTVALWGDPPGVTVDGDELRGALPATTRVIPFAVTGEGPTGDGDDLRVPARARRRRPLARAARGAPIARGRPSSSRSRSTWPTSSPSPAAARLEVGRRRARLRRAQRTPRARSNPARPSATTRAPGAPWVDACQVPVRIAGQDDWTYLSVPIIVRALDPQPELRAGSMTVGPGETATFDLRNMTTLAAARGLGAASGTPSTTPARRSRSRSTGSIVTVVGADRAVPGVGGGGDRLGHEPHRRRAGAPHPPRRRRAVDAAAGRVADAAVLAGRRVRRAPISVIGAERRGQPAAAHAARGDRRARRPARASG